jgi:hypothetical protein
MPKKSLWQSVQLLRPSFLRLNAFDLAVIDQLSHPHPAPNAIFGLLDSVRLIVVNSEYKRGLIRGNSLAIFHQKTLHGMP